MTASDIINRYISFFEKRGHIRISNSSLVPENDPSTLFTSSGMQPLVPYLLGEAHPAGKRLVNVQNCFRAQDIDEIGDNRHITFFRMLGNWSLGDYFKEQLSWIFEFLINKEEGIGLDPKKLFVTVFGGDEVFKLGKDKKSIDIWKKLFNERGIVAEDVNYVSMEDASERGMRGGRIFSYGVEKNWWSRSGIPEKMPQGEPGGPDSEIFYDLGTIHDNKYGDNCHPNCDCGRFMEIGNSVFMQYLKTIPGLGNFIELPEKNVDFGGGLERLLAAVEDKQDMFETNLLRPIIQSIEKTTGKKYSENAREMRIVTDHFITSVFVTSSGVYPSNKEHGYILRRFIRRGFDNFYLLGGEKIDTILKAIVAQYKETDPILVEKYEFIKNTILEEEQKYKRAQGEAKKFIEKRYSVKYSHPNPLPEEKGVRREDGDELMGVTEISAEDAFLLYTTHGLSPTQIKSLGYTFNDQEFAEKIKEHQKLSREGAKQKFKGGLADHSEFTVKGHTATHLLHQALRDVLGGKLHQSGSNITSERVRFDFNYEKKITPDEIKKVEDIVNQKIAENLPVHFELMSLQEAKKLGAIGLFNEKYGEIVKVYFIGEGTKDLRGKAYSVEFCGGPHVEFTGAINRFTIIKEEGLGKGIRRIYAKVE